MNLLEHYIKEVYSVEDITEEFKRNVGHEPCRPMVKVKMRVNCYGKEEDAESTFFADEWETAQKQGYYMA